jgi:hypothetical protein
MVGGLLQLNMLRVEVKSIMILPPKECSHEKTEDFYIKRSVDPTMFSLYATILLQDC